jgi:signal transduction histidine kinase
MLAGSEISRLERMLNEVLSYARPIELHTNTLNFSDFLDDFISTNDAMLDEKKQRFIMHKEAQPTIIADRDKLNQICLNLVRNASDAAEQEQAITVTLSTTDHNTDGIINQTATLSVHNSGDYIPADKLPHITEAFVSTKTKGTGLGLAIVKNLVDALQGQMNIESTKQVGTTFTIHLPLAK